MTALALTVSQVEKTLDKREVPVGQAMRGTHLNRRDERHEIRKQ